MRLALASIALLSCACPGQKHQRTYPVPAPVDLTTHVNALPERARTLVAGSKTDVRLGKDRVNVSVDIGAAWGGKLRFQAHDPNDSMAADLASDGVTYCFQNAHDNCGECGPASAHAVGRLLGIVMEPDDVVAVLMGGTPLLDPGAGGETTVRWDESEGREILDIARDGWRQHVELDGKGKRWDVVLSELKDPKGKTVWRIRHKDFHVVDGVRLPGKSLVEQAGESARILWRDQKINGEIREDLLFHMEIQPGLRPCS